MGQGPTNQHYGDGSSIDIESVKKKATMRASQAQPELLRVVEIFPSGKGLKNLDQGRDKSDTFCVLKMKWQAGQVDWHEVDHTETIFDDLDPKWQHHFSVIFNFGQTLHLRFEVYDQDNNQPPELIGTYETTLAELVRQQKGMEFPLMSKHAKAGSLQLVVQEKQEAKSNVKMQMQVQGLPERTALFKCNFATTYFMEMWKGPEGSRAKFHESEFFVDEFTHDFNLEFTDAVLCNAK